MSRSAKFNPDKATDDALKVSKAAYASLIANLEKGVDKDSTGSDRLNEMKAIQFGIGLLPDLIRKTKTLQDMKDKKDYDTDKDIDTGDSEQYMG